MFLNNIIFHFKRKCFKKMLTSNSSQASKCFPQTPARLQDVALKCQPGFKMLPLTPARLHWWNLHTLLNSDTLTLLHIYRLTLLQLSNLSLSQSHNFTNWLQTYLHITNNVDTRDPIGSKNKDRFNASMVITIKLIYEMKQFNFHK